MMKCVFVCHEKSSLPTSKLSTGGAGQLWPSDDDDDDIYIMMNCLSVCLSRKMSTFLKGLSVVVVVVVVVFDVVVVVVVDVVDTRVRVTVVVDVEDMRAMVTVEI